MRFKIRLDGRKSSYTKIGFPVVIYLTSQNEARKEYIFRTGFYSEKKYWDATNGVPKKTHPEFLDLINYIENTTIKIRRLHREHPYTLTYRNVIEMVTETVTGVFYEDAIQHTDKRKTTLSPLKKFNEHFPNYRYQHIDRRVVGSFIELLKKDLVNGKPRSPNGIVHYLSSLTTLWNKMETGLPSPFSGHRIKKVPTANKALSDPDIIKMLYSDVKKVHLRSNGGLYNYQQYWKLCFLLGGLDMVDLVHLTYAHISNGRLEFRRFKGGTDAFISNKVFPAAYEILEQYKGVAGQELIPLDPSQLRVMQSHSSRLFVGLRDKLKLSRKPYFKSPRYSFINRGKNLLIDERICEEIVGHQSQSTHSIYKGKFPDSVKDAAHLRMITLESKRK